MKFYKKVDCEFALYDRKFLNDNACQSFIDFFDENQESVVASMLAEDANKEPDSKIRSSKSLFIHPGLIHETTHKNIYDFVDKANNDNWRFDISFLESAQIIKYDQPGDHYSWHTDWGTQANTCNRKLTLIIQLSNPNDYEGCDLELQFAPEKIVMHRDRGATILFPSFALHRATPLISGERYILVLWFSGDSFT